MNKHTPGPWLFRGKSNGVFTAPPPDTAYRYGNIIFQFDDVAEPSYADLDLILAAPDLLEALEKAVEYEQQKQLEGWIAKESPSGDCDEVHSKWIESADYLDFVTGWGLQLSAITKARGES